MELGAITVTCTCSYLKPHSAVCSDVGLSNHSITRHTEGGSLLASITEEQRQGGLLHWWNSCVLV